MGSEMCQEMQSECNDVGYFGISKNSGTPMDGL